MLISWSSAYVCHVRCNDSRSGTGKHVFPRRRFIHSGHTVLCRNRNAALPPDDRFKVPAFLGSSFAFLGGFQTVANLDTGIFADMSYGEKLPYACGGVLIAGLLYLLLSLIIKVIGVRRVMRFLPPVVTGPIIICIGLSLAPSAISNASTNWPLALIALATVIIFNIWGKGMFKIIRSSWESSYPMWQH